MGSGIAVVFLTTVLGGFAAFGLSYFLVWFLEVSNFEGGSGYLVVFVTLAGIAGGFVVGLLTAVTMSSGFGAKQMRAAEIVLALTILAGLAAVLSKVFEDKGPKLDGDSIRLEVEYKCPRGWKPDNALKAGHGGCWVQKYPEDGPVEQNPFVSGSLTWDREPAPGEPWTISCVVPLEKTASPRYVLIYTSKSIDVTFQVPLPRHPGAPFQQWSAWSTAGFLPQKRTPKPPDGFAFRFRIHKDAEYRAAHPTLEEAFKIVRDKALAAMPKSPTVADWLPFYENAWGVAAVPQETLGPEVAAVQEHPEALLPLLNSEDMVVARRAMFATTFLKTVPPDLIEPLARTGLQTIAMIRAARAAALPGDPDEVAEEKASSFYTQWKMAMDHARGAELARPVMEQIASELASGPLDEKLGILAAAIKKELEETGQAKSVR